MAAGKTPKKRRPLDRDRVLLAAIELADEEGLASLSMRRLGHRLGVEAMSLYNHVADKDALLAGIVDLIVGDVDVSSEGTWKDAMRRRALSMRATFARHPWALGLLESRRSMGPAALRYCDAVLGVLRRGGFSQAAAMRAFAVLDSYVYGYAIQEKNLPSGSATEATRATEDFLEALPGDAFPYLAEAARALQGSPYDFAREFERGLELILDALESWRRSGAGRGA